MVFNEDGPACTAAPGEQPSGGSPLQAPPPKAKGRGLSNGVRVVQLWGTLTQIWGMHSGWLLLRDGKS